MKNNDEIRELLRRADPAEGRELSPLDRARMRATLTSEASRRRPSRSMLPLLVAGAVAAAIVIAAIATFRRADPEPLRAVARPAPTAEPRPVAVVASAAPSPRPIAVRRLPRRESRPETGATQIMFTAPEGTRIFWFVGSPDAKEQHS